MFCRSEGSAVIAAESLHDFCTSCAANKDVTTVEAGEVVNHGRYLGAELANTDSIILVTSHHSINRHHHQCLNE